MGWLSDWDDVIHGTAVFGAAVPLGVAMLLGSGLPRRLWIAVAGALIVPVLWIFGWPSWPLRGSDDAAVAGLVAATLLVALETARNWSGPRRAAVRALVWTSLGWLLYPAWLAAEGGIGRRILVAGAVGLSIAAWAALVEFLAQEKKGENGGAFRITPAAWVPPSIALSVLLQFGAATRFAQCSGALAAATGGVCLLLIFSRGEAGLRPLAALWGMLSALLAWSGWLFAEIQIGATLALLLTPLAALAARRIPLPRRSEFLEQLWDGLAAAIIAGLVISASWIE